MKKSKTDLLKSFFRALINIIKVELKGRAVKLALKALLKTCPWLAGPMSWFISFAVEHLFEEVAVPLANLVNRKIGYQIDVADGKRVIKKLEESESEEEYDDALDDLFD